MLHKQIRYKKRTETIQRWWRKFWLYDCVVHQSMIKTEMRWNFLYAILLYNTLYFLTYEYNRKIRHRKTETLHSVEIVGCSIFAYWWTGMFDDLWLYFGSAETSNIISRRQFWAQETQNRLMHRVDWTKIRSTLKQRAPKSGIMR